MSKLVYCQLDEAFDLPIDHSLNNYNQNLLNKLDNNNDKPPCDDNNIHEITQNMTDLIQNEYNKDAEKIESEFYGYLADGTFKDKNKSENKLKKLRKKTENNKNKQRDDSTDEPDADSENVEESSETLEEFANINYSDAESTMLFDSILLAFSGGMILLALESTLKIGAKFNKSLK
jgi:hypothetical protein